MNTVTLALPNAIKTKAGVAAKTVELTEMSGEEEDILADQTRDPRGKGTMAKPVNRRITEILSRCTVSIADERRPDGRDRFALPSFFESHWAAAKSNDRMFAMIRLRQLTLGPEYVFKENCVACKKEIARVTVDLSELEVHDVPVEVAALDTHVIKLPRSGDEVTWRFLLGSDEDYIDEVLRTMKDQFISAILLRRLVSVNGGPVPDGLNYLRRMSSQDRRFLANHFDMTEGGIDTEVKIVCDGCSTEFTRMINPGRPDFFFPTAAASTSSSTSHALPNAGAGAKGLLSGSHSPGASG